MRNAIFSTIALFLGATGLFVLGHPAQVRAQSALCPSSIGGAFTGISLQGGLCTNANTPGVANGLLPHRRLLRRLSQLRPLRNSPRVLPRKRFGTRRAASRTAASKRGNAVPRVFRGWMEPASESRPPWLRRRPPSRPNLTLRKAKKTKAAAIRREQAAEATPKIVHIAAPPPPVFAPVPIEPAVRFAAWTQLYGDYETRSAQGTDLRHLLLHRRGTYRHRRCHTSGRARLERQSRTGTVGFQAGADLISRGLFSADDGLIVGLTVGYVSSDLTLNSTSVSGQAAGNSTARLHATLPGPTAGLYATYFNGGFSTDFILKVDALTLNETFNQFLVTTDTANRFLLSAGGGSVPLLNATVAGNFNYRFDLYPNLWIEPTVGAQYTNSSYGSNAFQLGLDDGSLVRVQGGARVGTTTLINDRVLMTSTLTGLAYDDVLVAGGFIPAAAFDAKNLLVQQDQGKVRGRGILALNFDCGYGITSFVQGEVRGGSGVFGTGGRAGVRYQW